MKKKEYKDVTEAATHIIMKEFGKIRQQEGDKMIGRKKTPAEKIGLSDDEMNRIWKECRHAKIDVDSPIELIKVLFPNSKENQVKAWFMYIDGFDQCEARQKIESEDGKE